MRSFITKIRFMKNSRVALLHSRVVAAFLMLMSGAALAQSTISQDVLEELLRVKTRSVQHLALNPVIVKAVKQQNAQALSLDEIKKRDTEWSATDEETNFKRSLYTNSAGGFLQKHVKKNRFFTEAFVTDNQGANVAAYPPTSDYWQGDEGKWANSFNNGKGEVFVGPIELDESAGSYQAQVSAPVVERGKTIGVLVVGVALTYIEN